MLIDTIDQLVSEWPRKTAFFSIKVVLIRHQLTATVNYQLITHQWVIIMIGRITEDHSCVTY